MVTRSGENGGGQRGQVMDQLEARKRPIGAQNGQRQRLWTDQNPVGAMPVEQAGRRDAHSLKHRVSDKPVRPVRSS